MLANLVHGVSSLNFVALYLIFYTSISGTKPHFQAVIRLNLDVSLFGKISLESEQLSMKSYYWVSYTWLDVTSLSCTWARIQLLKYLKFQISFKIVSRIWPSDESAKIRNAYSWSVMYSF